ncbi:MAG: FMN-binding protein [Actinomycetota bacterium]
MKIHLRKIILSMLVIASFAFYATYQRFGDSLQNYINNLQTRQVASESYSFLSEGFSRNQVSADPPADISKEAEITYPQPSEVALDGESYAAADSQSAVEALYKDGKYDGRIADAYYGYIQVRAIIESGMLTGVQFLSYPSDRSYSVEINKHAMPILEAEAIKNQSANVDIVAGATNTSNAFRSSLGYALSLAGGSSSEIFSVLQAPGKTVDIVSGATNISLSSTGVSTIKNQGIPVNIVSGATNISSTSTGVNTIQNQGTPVNIVSGATNISSTSSGGTSIQNQATPVNVVSGATNISSGTSTASEETADYESEDNNEDDAEYAEDDETEANNEYIAQEEPANVTQDSSQYIAEDKSEDESSHESEQVSENKQEDHHENESDEKDD